MARTAKKQAQAKVEDDDDNDGWDEGVVDADGKDGADLRLRDWRDVERFREMKDLRRLVDDDYGLEEIFHLPLKPRAEGPPRSSKLQMPAKLLPKPEPAKPAAKAAAPAPAKKGAPPPKAAAKPAKAVHAKPKPQPKAAKPKAKKR